MIVIEASLGLFQPLVQSLILGQMWTFYKLRPAENTVSWVEDLGITCWLNFLLIKWDNVSNQLTRMCRGMYRGITCSVVTKGASLSNNGRALHWANARCTSLFLDKAGLLRRMCARFLPGNVTYFKVKLLACLGHRSELILAISLDYQIGIYKHRAYVAVVIALFDWIATSSLQPISYPISFIWGSIIWSWTDRPVRLPLRCSDKLTKKERIWDHRKH